MRVAVAGVPGAWSTERMCQALRDEGIDSFAFSLSDCLHDLSSRIVLLHGEDLGRLHAIVVKKLGEQQEASARLRLHMLRELEQAGVRIYSRPGVIDTVMDRYRMTMKLIEARLPIPRTLSGEAEGALQAAAEQLGSGLAKPVYTSKGRGFIRLGAGAGGAPHANGRMLVQEFIEAPGRDIGACVLGGRFVGAFYRVAAPGEWLTSTSAGGTYAPCELSVAGRNLAEAAAEEFGLDFTVVDLVEAEGGYLVYEVSAFGGFRGLWEAYHFDVATHYARYIRGDLLA
jgi:ribosomal protein S6--L-glutamate ligase